MPVVCRFRLLPGEENCSLHDKLLFFWYLTEPLHLRIQSFHIVRRTPKRKLHQQIPQAAKDIRGQHPSI